MASKSTLELVMFMMITIAFLLISLAPLSFSSSSSPLSGTNNTKRIGFTAPLFHSIYSPQSPFYNPNLTEFERLQLSIKSSRSRYKFLLKSRFPDSSFVDDDDEYYNSVEAPVSPFHDKLGSMYMLRYHIGTPPVPIFAFVDTGSSLNWIQCYPCYYCYEQSFPIFDPERSSSYAALNCNDPDIKNCSPGTGICNTNNNTCSYVNTFIDKTYTIGSLATETLIFDSDVRPPGIIELEKIAFGCGHNNWFKNAPMPLGIMGLDRGELSFLSQIDNTKFSHCFLPMDRRPSKETSTMRFGSAALFLGETTPMITNPTSPDLYYLNLEGISVGNERIRYPPGTFNITRKGRGGLVLDSGSSSTMLNWKAYAPMVESIKRQIPFKDIGQRYEDFRLCYWCSWYGIARKTPYITFHFTGLDLVLSKEQTWVKVHDGKWLYSYWCLGIEPDNSNSLSTFGNRQMKNMNVGYDLENKVVSFKKVDCSKT